MEKILIAGIASLITGIVAFAINFRNNKLKYVTEERQKWRARIKELVNTILSDVDTNNRSKAIQEMILSLNPKKGDQDQEILDILFESLNTNEKKIETNKRLKFIKEVQNLLKYEWEKAKYEAHFSFSLNELLISILLISFIVILVKVINIRPEILIVSLSLILFGRKKVYKKIKGNKKLYKTICKDILDIPFRGR